MKIFAYGLSALLVIVISAEATDRFYGDLKANSPNGRFHAEAKSPANRRGNCKTPFQRDFTVTFTDTRTRQAMWSWKQRKDDASPSELIPTDDGYLIMLDAWDAYCVFDTKGVRTDVLDVLNSLPEQEKKAFTDWTTAGRACSDREMVESVLLRHIQEATIAEPESPGYLAFRSEPDFRRSQERY
jgi:hypothetical protein